jgi:hypothetical protein
MKKYDVLLKKDTGIDEHVFIEAANSNDARWIGKKMPNVYEAVVFNSKADNDKVKNMKKYKVQDREAGNVIETGLTEEEAQKLLLEYEESDKKEGTFAPEFYEIKEEDLTSATLTKTQQAGELNQPGAEELN